MKTKLKTKILTFILIFNVLTLSFVPCVNTYKTEAAAAGAATVANIAGYILSVLGATDMLTDGGVRGVSSSLLDSLKNKISEKLGDGIYVDSDGNYVFSNDASAEIYNILNSDIGTSTRVMSNFGSNESILNGSVMHPDFINSVSTKLKSMSNYAILYNQGVNNYDHYIYTIVAIVNTSNIAYFFVNPDSELSFKNSSLSNQSTTVYYYWCSFNTSSGQFVATNNSSSQSKNSFGNYIVDSSDYYAYSHLPHFSASGSCSIYYSNSVGTFSGVEWSMRSDNSVIISKNNASANAAINQTSGIVYNASTGSIPSIKESVINNNDWSKIYNNYVTNVQTQYTTNDKDLKKLRQAMKTYSDNIVNVINSGNDNILQQILDTNGWLTEIYDKIDQIYTYLTNMQSGGGGSDCPWTSEQITSMLNWLEQIENNTSYGYSIASSLDSIDENTYDSYTEILAMKTLLQQILSALQNGGGGGGGTPSSPSYTIPNTKIPWDDLDDLTSDNITNYVTNTQIIQGLLEDTAIFAYAVIIGDIVNGLATEPQVPQFNIPFEYDSGYTGVSFDYDFDLDLDDLHFENVHALLIAGECVLFTLYCSWLFLKLIQIVYEFLK